MATLGIAVAHPGKLCKPVEIDFAVPEGGVSDELQPLIMSASDDMEKAKKVDVAPARGLLLGPSTMPHRWRQGGGLDDGAASVPQPSCTFARRKVFIMIKPIATRNVSCWRRQNASRRTSSRTCSRRFSRGTPLGFWPTPRLSRSQVIASKVIARPRCVVQGVDQLDPLAISESSRGAKSPSDRNSTILKVDRILTDFLLLGNCSESSPEPALAAVCNPSCRSPGPECARHAAHHRGA
jgi:hypothetical protein